MLDLDHNHVYHCQPSLTITKITANWQSIVSCIPPKKQFGPGDFSWTHDDRTFSFPISKHEGPEKHGMYCVWSFLDPKASMPRFLGALRFCPNLLRLSFGDPNISNPWLHGLIVSARCRARVMMHSCTAWESWTSLSIPAFRDKGWKKPTVWVFVSKVFSEVNLDLLK